MFYEVRNVEPAPAGAAPNYQLVDQYPSFGSRIDRDILVTSTNEELLELLANILRKQDRLEARIDELENPRDN